jgi:hypothetical protein
MISPMKQQHKGNHPQRRLGADSSTRTLCLCLAGGDKVSLELRRLRRSTTSVATASSTRSKTRTVHRQDNIADSQAHIARAVEWQGITVDLDEAKERART